MIILFFLDFCLWLVHLLSISSALIHLFLFINNCFWNIYYKFDFVVNILKIYNPKPIK